MSTNVPQLTRSAYVMAAGWPGLREHLEAVARERKEAMREQCEKESEEQADEQTV